MALLLAEQPPAPPMPPPVPPLSPTVHFRGESLPRRLKSLSFLNGDSLLRRSESSSLFRGDSLPRRSESSSLVTVSVFLSGRSRLRFSRRVSSSQVKVVVVV